MILDELDHELPISESGDEFDPYSDSTVGLSGEYPDENQSEPDLGSPVELGGQDTPANTLSVADGKATGPTTQNLTGQSDSPVAVSGSSSGGSFSGSGSAAGTVDLGTHDGDTTVLSAMQTLGPNLAVHVLTGGTPTNPTPTPAGTGAVAPAPTNPVVLVQTKQSGLSLGANMILFAILAVVGVAIVGALIDG
jgi:hypothetical protein